MIDSEEEKLQDEPLEGMVPNSAGGYAWEVDDMRRLRRFMCLGSEGGTYYIGEKKLGQGKRSGHYSPHQ